MNFVIKEIIILSIGLVAAEILYGIIPKYTKDKKAFWWSHFIIPPLLIMLHHLLD